MLTGAFLGVFVVLCAGVAIHADSRGRSTTGWFTLAALISPLLAFLLLLCLPRRSSAPPAPKPMPSSTDQIDIAKVEAYLTRWSN